MDVDEDPPWPNIVLLHHWWNQHESGFNPGTRYIEPAQNVRTRLFGPLCRPPDYADLTSRTHVANDYGGH
jgi:hypothetical protein